MLALKERDDNYWTKRSLDRSRSYFNNTERFNKRLIGEFDKAKKQIDKAILKNMFKYGFEEGENNFTRIRLNAVMREVNGILSGLYGVKSKEMSGIQTTIYEHLHDNYEGNYNKTAFETYKGLGIVDSGFVKPNMQAIELAIKEPYLGENFSTRLYNHKKILSNTLRTEITSQFILGTSYVETAANIAKKVGTSYNAAVRLVRTESTTILNRSTLQFYKDSELVEKYRYVATLDNRTSLICQELDGMIFDVKDGEVGVNLPAMHPNCRSTTVPEFDYQVLGTRMAKENERYKRIPSDLTYTDWAA